MFQTFNFFKFKQLTFFNVFVEQLQFEQLTFCSKTCICSKWLFWGFSSSLIFFGICSNSVEQSRFWCRAVFLSRWISSSWPFSNIPLKHLSTKTELIFRKVKFLGYWPYITGIPHLSTSFFFRGFIWNEKLVRFPFFSNGIDFLFLLLKYRFMQKRLWDIWVVWQIQILWSFVSRFNYSVKIC